MKKFNQKDLVKEFTGKTTNVSSKIFLCINQQKKDHLIFKTIFLLIDRNNNLKYF